MNPESSDRRVERLLHALTRRALTRGLLAASVALGAGVHVERALGKPKKRKRSKKNGQTATRTVCHCPTSDPALCKTRELPKKKAQNYLNRYCGYRGKCQPGLVGTCNCETDDHCREGRPFCVASECQQCRTDLDCVGENAGPCLNGSCSDHFVHCAGGGATTGFVTGPGTPPESTGSVQFTVPPLPDALTAVAGFLNANFAGVHLAQLTELTYASYTSLDDNGNCSPNIPYIVLYLGDAEIIVNMPYQPAECGVWRVHDALTHNWWSPTFMDGSTLFAPLGSGGKHISDYIATFGQEAITIRNEETWPDTCPGGNGGLRMGAGQWNAVGQVGAYRSNVSYIRVGVDGQSFTYRF
ncbi:MAG: hypothetical protein QM692_08740 [Thermomicrobiales bacterium]